MHHLEPPVFYTFKLKLCPSYQISAFVSVIKDVVRSLRLEGKKYIIHAYLLPSLLELKT